MDKKLFKDKWELEMALGEKRPNGLGNPMNSYQIIPSDIRYQLRVKSMETVFVTKSLLFSKDIYFTLYGN